MTNIRRQFHLSKPLKHVIQCGLTVLFLVGSVVVAAAPQDLARRWVGYTDVALPTSQPLSQQQPAVVAYQLSAPPAKHVRLLKVQLSGGEKQQLRQRLQNLTLAATPPKKNQVVSKGSGFFKKKRVKKKPKSKQLGMNGVPVLDQGIHGSCVTFANAAAIDALFALYEDEQMSPLCQLQLSRSLQPEWPYGDWEGSTGDTVHQAMFEHGFLHRQYERTAGCGGLTSYPSESDNIGSPMPIDLFDQNSDHRFTPANRTVILGMAQYINDEEALFQRVKQSIDSDHRVVIGALLDTNVGLYAGLAGAYQVQADTWVITQTLLDDLFDEQRFEASMAGHEIVVTGYDDGACASTDEGAQQCGLFTVRNSWGTQAGHGGNFYMSYDYLKAMLGEAYALHGA